MKWVVNRQIDSLVGVEVTRVSAGLRVMLHAKTPQQILEEFQSEFWVRLHYAG